jgi:hypothetical protein
MKEMVDECVSSTKMEDGEDSLSIRKIKVVIEIFPFFFSRVFLDNSG